MLRALPVLVVLPVVLAYGVAEGLWTDRWGLSPGLQPAAARLADVPLSVGPWRGEESELDPRQVRQAELVGHILRRYVHRTSGEALTVLAVCGRPGPIGAHTPRVCFAGGGFSVAKPATVHRVAREEPFAPSEFWSERYEKRGAAIPEQLQIYYGWNSGSGWQAVNNPRLYFGSAPFLYKLYVSRSLPSVDEPAEADPIPAFLRVFIPELQRSLFDTPRAPLLMTSTRDRP